MNSFPNFKNKDIHDSLFSPEDYLTYLKKVIKGGLPDVPKNIVFTYQSSFLEYIKKRTDFRKSKDLSQIFPGSFFVSKDFNLGVIGGFGIGSPVATTILEELIVLGSERFFNIGTAGSLQKYSKLGEIIICTKAIRDEGTSHHYIKPEKYAFPSKKLLNSLESVFIKNDVLYKKGGSWTIDAPYRETIEEAKIYRSEGIYTVEMEAAALFSVAKYRGVDIVAVFSVSDLLGELEWSPGSKSPKTSESLVKIFDSVVELNK